MTKTTTLIASCCLALLAMPAAGLACDKDKTACSSKDKAQPTVLKVNSDGTCGTKDAREIINAARIAQGCEAGAKVANVKSSCSDAKGVANVLTASGCNSAKGVANAKSSCSDAKGVANVLTASGCNSAKGVANVKSSCSDAKGVANVLTASGCNSAKGVANVKSSCSDAKGVANVKNASDCASGCPKQQTVSLLMNSLKGGCGAECASKTDVVAALRMMSTYEKGLVCEKSLDQMMNVANVRTVAKGDCDPADCATACATACKDGAKNQVVSAPLSDCTSSKPTVVAVGQGSGCCAAKAKGNKQVANITTAGGVCNTSKASDASTKYVAYGCDKTDRIARAAAKAYLAMMSELKGMSGAEGCSISAAKDVLAAMINDMERNSKTEIAAVSFGAVSEKKSESGCSAK